MNKAYSILFFGFLSVIMGIGKDESELIPSEIKLLVGGILIVYGIFLMYQSKSNAEEPNRFKGRFGKKGRSYIFLAIGILLIKSPSIFDPNYEYTLHIISITIFCLGFGFIIYGLNVFFKEKRDKKESGSIE